MSTFWDVADTDEQIGKGKSPKEKRVCTFFLGHAVNSCMTVISN